MNKLANILVLLTIFAISATAQENRLSKMDDKPEQKPTSEQQEGTILGAKLNILLKADNTWVVNDEKYITLTADDGEKYVLFANGNWSDIITIKDIDGNSYDAAKIGKYYWTLQNLRTTKYNDGKTITFAPTNHDAWRNSAGAYTNVEDKPENKNKQGLLYSWHAADKPNLCPEGWRVPTEAEWLDLIDNVGGSATAGKELKSENGWKAFEGSDKKTAGEDNYMFNAMPTGYRQLHADKRNFYQVGGEATFWSKTSKTKSQAVSITFTLNENVLRGHWPKEFGRSIRCIKND